MKRVWRLYRGACVIIVTAAATLLIAVASLGFLHDATMSAASVSVSPDKAFQVRVFTAGQGSVPPDYRTDVRFWLYDASGVPLFRTTLLLTAAFADGWSVKWSGAHDVTVNLGRLSSITSSVSQARGVAVHVVVESRSPDEATCIEQSVANVGDGIKCFDAMLNRRGAPAH